MRYLMFLLILLSLFFPSIIFAHSQTQVIEMTPSGFVPNSITVDEDATIIFLNKDSKPRWPASNVHPTHDLYPEFDPQKPVAPSASWTFKPKKPGEWKYHDHLLPHIRGMLTVVSEEGETKRDPPLIERVNNTLNNLINQMRQIFSKVNIGQKYVLDGEKFKNLSSQDQIDGLKKFANSQGVEKIWQFILDTFKGQGGSSGNIHDLAHLTGSLIYTKRGFSGIGICSSEFAFGCFHGFLDEAFKKDLSKLTEAQDACSKLGPGQSGPVASCIHGIGHGVASFHQTSDLKRSLADCRKLTLGREYCFDGVFMEFVRSAPESFFKKDDPLYPCNLLEKEYGPTYSFSCGRNIPSLLMGRFNRGFDEIVDICRSSKSKPFKEACFDSLGFSLAATADVSKIIAGCQSIQIAEFVLKCTKAAAGELVFQEVPNWQEKSQAVCQSFPEGKVECLAHVDRLIKEYSRVKKINFTPRKEGEDPNSYIRGQMKVCFETDGADGCYKQVAKLLYDNFGLSQTLGYFAANEGYPEVYARCHEVTHYLSRLEYEKLGSIARVYAQCDSTCHGGCYHGTMEAFLKEKEAQFGNNLSSEFAKVCGSPKDYRKPLEFNECLHGMGHAAMFITEMELRQSLALCDGFTNQDQKERCYSGAFMENSSSSTSNDHRSIYLKADDPFYPCTVLEEKYLPLCWQYQSSYFSIVSGQDFRKVALMCLQIPAQYQDRCFRTIGTNQVGFTSSLERMRDNCNLMPNQFINTCVVGVISSLTYRFVGDTQKMIDFCLIVKAESRESCYKQIGTGVLDWVTDRGMAKKECSKIPDPQGLDWCLNVI